MSEDIKKLLEEIVAYEMDISVNLLREIKKTNLLEYIRLLEES